MDWNSLIATLRRLLPREANDLLDVMSLVRDTLVEIRALANQAISESVASNDFARVRELTDLAEQLTLLLMGSELPGDAGSAAKPAGDGEEHGLLTDANESVTFRRPTGYRLGEGPFRAVRTWKELLVSVLRDLSDVDPDLTGRLPELTELNGRSRLHFSREAQLLRSPYRIVDNIYAEINKSAADIRRTLYKVIGAYGYQADDFRLYLVEEGPH